MMRAIVMVLLLAGAARGELVSLEWHTREPYQGGKSFGEVGPYEKLVGVARFAVDPAHARNKVVVDLDQAPRNIDGKVEFQSDVYLLRPKDLARGNGALLYDVNNRGNKLALGMFQGGDPGDGFLFRRGWCVLWSGWISELLPGNGRLLMQTPVLHSVSGVVRCEMVTDRAVESMPLSRRDGHGSYPPSPEGERSGVLTWRMREKDDRVVIPRSQWSLEKLPIPKVEKGVSGTLPQVRLKLAGGFRPGYIYELVCEASGPTVQGLGFAGVRDLVSHLKYGEKLAKRAHGFGVSQSGRFLRHFVYEGFNADEKGRKVFDGVMPHVAGGGLGFFNHRFAQPTRHNGQHEEHLYPGDMFPFAYGDWVEDGGGGGILNRLAEESPKLVPRVMHTQSAAEYWHRSGSLVHTDPHGRTDPETPENVRIYAFGGTQHGPASSPPSRGVADNLANPGDYRPFLRSLLVALDDWAKDGTAPPPSVYPRIDERTLGPWDQKSTGFPSLPGVRYPQVIQQPSKLDFGPDFASKKIISLEPPRVVGHYRVLVPRSDGDGNDLGTLLPLEVRVPLATYTGWNLRRAEFGAEAQLASLMGSYIPFPRTEAERLANGDPRVSIEKRYGDFATYSKRWDAACDEYVKARYLLKEDIERLAAKRDAAKKAVE